MKKNVGPIIAVIVLLLPILYVASYWVLVVPSGAFIADPASPYSYEQRSGDGYMKSYCTANEFCERFFWPLEQADRKLRPGAWRPDGW
jgi:hypothetical protein